MTKDARKHDFRRAVLVTGGTVRLGRAISAALSAAGWNVLTSSHRADAGADIVADLSTPDGADELFCRVKSLCGGDAPFAVVNNAALFSGDAAAVASVNLTAPARLVELLADEPEPRAAVNILDAAVLPGAEGVRGRCEAYTLSKERLAERTMSDARRFAGRVRVNAVAPGPVMTLSPCGVREKAAATPFGRPRPEDVANAVVFLLSSATTTGCIIPV